MLALRRLILVALSVLASTAPASRAPADVDFQMLLNKVSVAGQNSVRGAIMLTQPQTANAVFEIVDDSTLVETPSAVTVPAGSVSKFFRIRVLPVVTPQFTTITASSGAIVRSQPLVLTPLAPSAMAFTPNPCLGGQTVSCRLVVNGVAGPAGLTIALSDNSVFATTPVNAVVPAGGTQAIFSITTSAVPSRQTVVLIAQANGLAKAGTFRILPPQQ